MISKANSYVFWENWGDHKLLSRFTDLYMKLQKENGENKTKRHLVTRATNKILQGPSRFNKILQAGQALMQ